MKHVRLLVLTEDLPQAAMALAETETFHPDPRPPEEAQLGDLPGRQYRETYLQAQSRLEKIAKTIAIDPLPELTAVRVIDHAELTQLNTWLGEIWEQVSGFEEALHRLDEAERTVREQQAALANFAALNIDLGLLRTKTRFLDFHVGLVPRENLRQLEGAVGLAKYLLHVYQQTGDVAHVVIVGPAAAPESSLTAVLNAAGFQNIPIPRELDREPAELQRDFETQRQRIGAEREQVRQALEQWVEPHREPLLAARRTLLLAEPLVTLDPSMRSSGQLGHIAGWVPARALKTLEARLAKTLQHPFTLAVRTPRRDELALVPTVPKQQRLLAPFAILVKQYGVPEYGEVDPTPLFAVTFLLMFGSMFGDIGQGAVIALAAWAFRRKLGRFWVFGLLAGLTSMFFGVLFGSFFGAKHVIPPLWMSPLSDPLLMLSLALGWGVFFITLACVLAIYNRLLVRNWSGAVFGHHGLVNLGFYLALVPGIHGVATRGEFGHAAASMVALCLAALAGYAWYHYQGSLGEKLLVVLIETLETVIGYISNTLSFLRVAAFSLNHVALSIAIFTLAGMMGAVGHVMMLIFGNLFVIVLEGAIVAIQVMRLQYYEGFSRYFSGNGHEFKPLRFRRPPPSAPSKALP